MAPSFNSYRGFFYRQLFITPPLPPQTFRIDGQVGLVTGSNTGLGLEAAKQLAGLGALHLVLAVRDIKKGEAARKAIFESVTAGEEANLQIDVWQLDLGDYASISAFADKLKKLNLHLNFAILNAGVNMFDFQLNSNTHNEISIQTNWLGTAFFTLLVLDYIEAQETESPSPTPPTITITGSETAHFAKFGERKVAAKKNVSIMSELNEKDNFDVYDRYPTSKLLETLFFYELLEKRKSQYPQTKELVTMNMVNPGLCQTELSRSARGLSSKIFNQVNKMIGRTTKIGARPIVHAAVIAGPSSNGKFQSDCGDAPYAEIVESDEGKALRKKLWNEFLAEMKTLGEAHERKQGSKYLAL